MTSNTEKIRFMAEKRGEDVLAVSLYLLDDPKFPVWSGSSQSHQHHYGQGGLAQHLFEVINLCFCVRNEMGRYEVDENELFLAALFHDAGKLYDYFPTVPGSYAEWGSTSHKRYIHHISRSAVMWSEASRRDEHIHDLYHDKVLHAILAHHGFREAGSPVAPKSRVAWLVHFCDGISARMYDADTLDVVHPYGHKN